MDFLPVTRKPTKPAPLTGEIVKAIELADLDLTPAPSKSSHVKRLTQRHHHLARCLAKGFRNYEAAAATGYAPVTISILKSDPAFMELVEAYKEKDDLVLGELHERLAGLAVDAQDLIRDRMENDPDSISIGQLLAMVELAADRTGHGPSSTTNSNINVGIAERLEAARKRVLDLRVTKEPSDD